MEVVATKNGQEPSAAVHRLADHGSNHPIREMLLGPDQLEDHARRLGALLKDSKAEKGRDLPRMFRGIGEALRVSHRTINEAYRNQETLGQDADWLLDNYHIISDALLELGTDLPEEFCDQLPKVQVGPLKGFPRVYAAALDLNAHRDSSLDESSITGFVQALQTAAPLTVGEIWAFPIMLRLCLLENLRRLAEHIVQFRVHHLRAHAWIASNVGGAKHFPKAADFDLERVPEPWRDCYVAHLLEGLHHHETVHPEGVEHLERRLADRNDACARVLQREKERQVANQVSIGNCVTSLRLLSALDWRDFFEATSLLEQVLRRDPARIYGRQDFGTRDRYRRAIEQMARHSRRDEIEVAQLLLARAAQQPSGSLESHIGYHLVDAGADAFAAELGCRWPWRDWQRRLWLGYPRTIYFGGIALILIGILGVSAWLSTALQEQPWLAALAVLASLIPGSALAVGIMQYLANAVLPPRTLARVKLKEGVPPELATFVVVPSMITSERSAAELVERLEIHYLANGEQNIFFALLTDFADAPAEQMPTDAALLRIASDGVQALNAKYGPAAPPRFFLLHRRRQWNASQGCWMGWERKRGKLGEFNRVLRGARDTSFATISSGLESLPRIRYVITLDTDTQLPREMARAMIELSAHPLNQPRFDPSQKRVTRGYGILQPRVSLSLRGAHKSPFARIYTGSAGIDPYTTAVSDTYQDLFGSGSFTGKGIYEVDAFEAAVGHALPDNHILSHDLIEGNYARCGLVTNVEVLDDFPSHYLAYQRREHRWIRGDWQIMPWLFGRVPGPDGKSVRNAMPVVERWKIFDNLRRSLVPPTLLALLILGWTVLPGSAWLWTAFAALVLAGPLLAQLVSIPLRMLVHRANPRFTQAQGRDLAFTASQAGLTLSCLVDHAYVNLDAIVRTLTRLCFTKRHLLEWTTAADTERRLDTTPSSFLRDMWAGPLLAVSVAAFLCWWRPEALLPAGIFLAGWFLSPIIAFLVSRTSKTDAPVLTPTEREELLQVARKTWGFFEAFVGAQDHWLPPDNYQEDPKNVVAHRTSPTNIGLYLLSCLAAHDLKFLNRADLLERLERTAATLETMERAHGHFFNWYDTQSLQPLQPKYLSTVDSGNLAACLITLKQGLLEFASAQDAAAHADDTAGSNGKAPPLDVQRCQQLALRFERLAAAMDFRPLYNSERHLFAVGYNVAANRLDSSHYDLLASEACLTSFLTIARGDVPREHWFRLGRPLTQADGHLVLYSWGGTMFEYLMPRLVLPIHPDTLLGESESGAVAAQIEYGARCRTPWGISESAYSSVDGDANYQYQAFGAPALGLKRGLSADLVVAPYATSLALMVNPRAALANLRRLQREGAGGAYGFYEAIDYTAERLPRGRRSVVVKCFMAHHQGMTLLAMANLLLDNVMPRRFRAEPMVRATELLLQERVPAEAPLGEPQQTETATLGSFHEVPAHLSRRLTTAHTAYPHTHLLASARYCVMVTNSGAGFSAADGLAVSRWREDRTCDAYGQFVFVRNLRTGKRWSAGYQPLCQEADEYEVIFATDKAEFRRLDAGIETRMEIAVSPENHAEVRRLTITNHDRRAHHLEITSYVEIVLGTRGADLSHPAFGKLFLETEYLPRSATLLCRRRPREAEQKPVWALHVLAAEGRTAGPVQYESDRARFIGRGRTLVDPIALEPGVEKLSQTVGPVLDPILSLRQCFQLEAGASVSFAFTTALAESREQAVALADYYHDLHSIHRAFELAWAHAQVELRQMHLTAAQAHTFQRLATHVFFAGAVLRPPSQIVARNRQGQGDLWRLGVSGDLPIVLLRIASADELAVARQVVAAHTFWRLKGLAVDLVILNDQEGGYFEDLQQQLQALVRVSDDRAEIEKTGGVYLRKSTHLTKEDQFLLQAVARCVLLGKRGMLANQLEGLERAMPAAQPGVLPGKPAAAANAKPPASMPIPERVFDNGVGGFSPDGREYIMRLRPRNGVHVLPPRPWVNVVANADFGFLISESGGGFTWAGNSQTHRLTPWRNDPVSDLPGEVIYLRDEAGGDFWSATPLPCGADADYLVRHGQGYTSFEHRRGDLGVALTLFASLDEPVKICRLRVRNLGPRQKRLAACFFIEWVLGANRDQCVAQTVTEIDADTGVLLARNHWDRDFSDRVAFVDVARRPCAVTGSRAEFLGRNGSLAAPAALQRGRLAGTVGACLDPCGAVQTSFDVPPGQEVEIAFLLGEGANAQEACRLAKTYHDPSRIGQALNAARAFWDRLTGALSVRTPDAALDMLVNRWLPYQVLSCRMWGRSALYQSGGAFGFRDQLQDSLALLFALPAEARRHILRAAGRQFLEGDVQHWWHPPRGAGVRTRFSDDYLWLPFAVHRYVEATGDDALLEEKVPYLQAPPLRPEQEEDYRVPDTAAENGSVFDHCLRAIEHGLRFGAHGLPLMGSGDWNDGMNRIGAQGRGESVWTGWFLLTILRRFADLCERRGDSAHADSFRNHARDLHADLELHGWDGKWYRRAYFDDGTPLGSAQNDECRIDSIVQSWAVISGAADPARARQAMEAVDEHLVRRPDRLVLLFAPPFDHGTLQPGYVKGYVPGIRENGGQYTHAALWAAQAWALLGNGNRAVEVLDLLNPILHADTPQAAARYGLEPYVLAADVYGCPPHVSRGGWSWYTGSASWYYRVMVETIFGFNLQGNRFRLTPHLPDNWPSAELTYRFHSAVYVIKLERASQAPAGAPRATADEQPCSDESFTLLDDGRTHTIVYRC